jgi:hypothetical protein
MIIKITGDADVNIEVDKNDPEAYETLILPLQLEELKKLDGMVVDQEDHEDFTEHISCDYGFKEPAYMKFKYDGRKKKLMVSVTYVTDRDLDDDQIKELMDYTTGQWSDGIGEGYEQTAAKQIDGNDVFISPWHDDQEIKYEVGH